ncbi:unnamed protein product [Merluccius merluccius]
MGSRSKGPAGLLTPRSQSVLPTPSRTNCSHQAVVRGNRATTTTREAKTPAADAHLRPAPWEEEVDEEGKVEGEGVEEEGKVEEQEEVQAEWHVEDHVPSYVINKIVSNADCDVMA